MEKLIKGIKIAAHVAEIITAGSVIIELVGKYGSKRKKKPAASVNAVAGNAPGSEV